jgi:starch synthase (maltosyl-transferring)
MTLDGRRRVVIEGVEPSVDGGRFPAKRTIGDVVEVEAIAFADGHDQILVTLLWKHESQAAWAEAPMRPLQDDHWRGQFSVERLGRYQFTLRAAIDHFGTWRSALEKRIAAGQDVALELLVGAALLREASAHARRDARRKLEAAAMVLESDAEVPARVAVAFDVDLAHLVAEHADTKLQTRCETEFAITVDPVRARYSTWYEMFPRSATSSERHGTFKDVSARLPYVKQMGFDVLYFPPIHPIGRSFRKGPNNTLSVSPEDPGSPWAIGGPEGGHRAIHPELGTMDDFQALVCEARERYDIEVALDIAFQASPDHPLVQEHPEWFRHRPDGSIQYAENPPKKYEDIYPFDFESAQWKSLWEDLRDTFLFWVDKGVKVFRVDNPHTKPFGFWEWCIAEIKRHHPEVIFLSEAFTRPAMMNRLAKLGFDQSYTYFAWRNTKWEITQYFTELSQTKAREFFRPNLWPNTPDILPEFLQTGGRGAFMARLVLAATLGASYGIYGPPFELMENEPREPGSEEYLNSEKYQVRQWNIHRADSLSAFIGLVNRARHENPALQSNASLRFHEVDNPEIIAYSKHTPDFESVIVTVVNLDPHHTHSGWLTLDLAALGIGTEQPYQMHELLTGARYLWHGSTNFVHLDPHSVPAHIFRVRRRVRSEHDFEYFI